MDKLGITVLEEVTNIFRVTKIIAATGELLEQTVAVQCLLDGQVYTAELCAELYAIWKEYTWTKIILIHFVCIFCVIRFIHDYPLHKKIF